MCKNVSKSLFKEVCCTKQKEPNWGGGGIRNILDKTNKPLWLNQTSSWRFNNLALLIALDGIERVYPFYPIIFLCIRKWFIIMVESIKWTMNDHTIWMCDSFTTHSHCLMSTLCHSFMLQLEISSVWQAFVFVDFALKIHESGKLSNAFAFTLYFIRTSLWLREIPIRKVAAFPQAVPTCQGFPLHSLILQEIILNNHFLFYLTLLQRPFYLKQTKVHERPVSQIS